MEKDPALARIVAKNDGAEILNAAAHKIN